jgi:hypothetical protein
MKQFLIFLAILGSLNANAETARYLVPCEATNEVCNVGSSDMPKNMLCMVSDSLPGSDYDVEIITTINDEITDVKQWVKGASLADGEEIRCRLNPVKVTTRLADEKAKEDAEKAKKDKDVSDWQAVCAKDKGDLATYLCAKYPGGL